MTEGRPVQPLVVTSLADLLAAVGCADLQALSDVVDGDCDPDMWVDEIDGGVEVGSGCHSTALTYPFPVTDFWTVVDEVEQEENVRMEAADAAGEDDRGIDQLISARESNPTGAYDEVFDEVAARVGAAGSAGKVDIGALLFWKRLRADTPWVAALHQVADSYVREVTARAVRAARDDTGHHARGSVGGTSGVGGAARVHYR
ncbi:hypothetical protein [Blastococcus sp. SYSU D01042]